MHYRVLLLTEAVDAEDAKTKCASFLEEYEHSERDRYEFGGRWEEWFGGQARPLIECMGLVKEAIDRYPAKLKGAYEKMIEEMNIESSSMKGWYAIQRGKLEQGYFSNNCIAYDIDYRLAGRMPSTTENIWCVCVDMHN